MTGAETLDLFLSRRSIRKFSDKIVDRDILERLLYAATSAPSNTNRQPWRFAVVSKEEIKKKVVESVRIQAERMQEIIQRGHHRQEFGNYGDFFHEPLTTAATIIIPQYRSYPDLIANFIASGNGNPKDFPTAADMQAELCSTSAAVMALLLQAHAEGLGGCWMAGPMIARKSICAVLGINKPWNMIGAIALGYPQAKETKKPRKSLAEVVHWF